MWKIGLLLAFFLVINIYICLLLLASLLPVYRNYVPRKKYFRREENKNSSAHSTFFVPRNLYVYVDCFLKNQDKLSQLLSYPVEEGGNDTRVDEIHKHGSDDRNDEEWLHGVVILVADGTHVCHRIWCGTEAESTDTCHQDGCVIVATQ